MVRKKTSPFDLRLIIFPRGYCNFRCIFCHREGYNKYDETSWRLSKGEFVYIWEKLSRMGAQGVTISGGEPLLAVDRLGQYLGACCAKRIRLITNGSLLSRFGQVFTAVPDRAWSVYLNIPSFDRGEYRDLTGNRGADPWRIAAEGLEWVSSGVSVTLNCVLVEGLNGDRRSLLHYLLQAKKLGYRRVRFLTSGVSGSSASTRVMATLGLKEALPLRDGRVMHFALPGGGSIEVVECDGKGTSKLGRSDLYVSTDGSIKVGLGGIERRFDTLSDIKYILRTIEL